MEFFLDTAEFWIFLTLLGVGYVAGRSAESKHYASIHAREETHLATPVITGKTIADPRPVASSALATGSVVIAIDYYKRFLMGLRNLVGGEAGAYASLIDRARREALLRMRESQPDADLFLNFRMQTATLFHGRGKNPSSIEIVAYATAIRFDPS